MRWFKHMTNSSTDEKLCSIFDCLGLEGYGFYWRVLEIIAQQMGKNSKTFCEYSPKIWGKFAGISAKKFENFIQIFSTHQLFLVKFTENSILVNCPNLLKYKDEYSTRPPSKEEKCRDKLPIVSGQTPEEIQIQIQIQKKKKQIPSASHDAGSNGTEPIITKKKRTLAGKRLEAFMQFWNAFAYKKAKAEAADAWLEIKNFNYDLLPKIIEAAQMEASSRSKLVSEGRTPIYPQGWLSGRRWEDEHADPTTQGSYFDE